ncbi:MAG: DNA-binding response regulator [Runella slithyformis]|nr:MAG: DNA-binding response regulator [Runella slithyformis]TAG17783.1 MAG: DNA-binding response regulator [Cytophagales bacterium]TAE98268.1 MAG: DNA-binding response regulator [Runella slithyformis]TAF28677.1 MAG: DNA-binding response regulator [Runella slithyformis]TAF82394.1 MAG: DNA-binding response regulator [Runella slithyformis]
MTAIAIDDEPKALDVVEYLAKKVPFLDLKQRFTDALEALDYLQHDNVDLIFLDIKMPDISGFDFLRTLASPPMVIFTTAYSEHALDSYEFNAIDYLHKPFEMVRFLKACNKAYDQKNLRQPELAFQNSIFVPDGTIKIRICVDAILFLKSDGNYVDFYTTERRITSRISLTEAEAMLPRGHFVRVHRSYIVAKNKIVKYDRNEITIGGQTIPIGDNYKESLKIK